MKSPLKLKFWQFICLAIAISSVPGMAQDTDQILTKIAFGSCADQFNPCPIWETIADHRPDLLLLLGDTVYADLENGRLKPATPERIEKAYQTLANDKGFARLRAQTPIMAVWDDHDFGNNDAGVEWEHKDVSAKLFHDFLGTPLDSPRRRQQGVYDARIFGPEGKRVQVIMLDTRYFRSALEKGDQPLPGFRALPYIPSTDPAAKVLGDAQWKWLEEQLRKPAEFRIVGSSIQVVSDQHPFEKWANFPLERERLYAVIRETAASGVVVISGDRHLGDISLDGDAIGYPLYDITASGFNQATKTWRETEPNRYRVAALPYGNHFGTIEIDWEQETPEIKLQLRHEDGELAVQSRVPLNILAAGPPPLPRPRGVLSVAEVIQLDEGKEVQVQFAVRGTRAVSGDRWLLNSEVDYRSQRNFTVVVNRGGRSEFPKEWSVDWFVEKTIRVSGTISIYNGAKQIVVDSPVQFEVIEAAD